MELGRERVCDSRPTGILCCECCSRPVAKNQTPEQLGRSKNSDKLPRVAQETRPTCVCPHTYLHSRNENRVAQQPPNLRTGALIPPNQRAGPVAISRPFLSTAPLLPVQFPSHWLPKFMLDKILSLSVNHNIRVFTGFIIASSRLAGAACVLPRKICPGYLLCVLPFARRLLVCLGLELGLEIALEFFTETKCV